MDGLKIRCSAAIAVLSLLLPGCAERRLTERSQRDLASGNADQALVELRLGAKQFPDSLGLRSSLLMASSQAVSQAMDQAGKLADEGRFDEAKARLEKTLAIEPDGDRLRKALADLAIQKRQHDALEDARGLIGRGQSETALQRVVEALRDNPRHAALLELQRTLEMDQRQILVRNAQAVLAEERPISLDFRDANLRSVLDVVSRSSGINFVFDRDLRSDARVTVFLRQAKVQDALDLITSSNQLSMKIIDPRTVLIYANTPDKQKEYQEQIVRVFYLANAEAKGAAA
jgi:general secretion pathway protein D